MKATQKKQAAELIRELNSQVTSNKISKEISDIICMFLGLGFLLGGAANLVYLTHLEGWYSEQSADLTVTGMIISGIVALYGIIHLSIGKAPLTEVHLQAKLIELGLEKKPKEEKPVTEAPTAETLTVTPETGVGWPTDQLRAAESGEQAKGTTAGESTAQVAPEKGEALD